MPPKGGEFVKQLLESRSALRFDGQLPSGEGRRRLGCAGPRAMVEKAVDEASRNFFGPPAAYMGEGGSIPFMGMLGEKFPGAQFLITGVLGPHSNAHGPNEFLHIPTGKARHRVCRQSRL